MEELTFIEKVRKIIKMRHDDIVSAMASGDCAYFIATTGGCGR